MSRNYLAGIALACLLFDFSCVKYAAHPLNPVRTEQQFRSRSFDGPLNQAALTAYALESNPDIAVANAKVATAEAALITARQRINPSISAEGGYNRTPESVSTYAISPAFTIETAGKRGYRILEAEKLAEAARIAVYEERWRVLNRIHTAFAACWTAAQKRDLISEEIALRDEVVAIYEKRVSLGETANPELIAARSDQASAAVSLKAAENETGHAVAALAEAAGLPVSALEGKPLDFAGLAPAALVEAPALIPVQKEGLLHRSDIRRSLIEYEASDARLRLALANQYPNITLSPSYAFQEGFPAYTLGSVIESLPVFHRNQGPIAQQEAALKQQEAEFAALQAKVVGETELALRQYNAAVREWRQTADRMATLQRQREDAVIAAFRAGDKDRLEVTQVRLETLAVKKSQTDALVRAQTALLALQDALQWEYVPKTPGTTN